MILYDPSASLPAFWEPFRSDVFTLVAIVLLPVIVAGVLGYALFKRRIKGAYFAILSQALAVALAVLISSTIRETGGDTGLSDFKYFFGFVLNDDANKLMVFMIAAALLIVCLLVVWQLNRSRFGELLIATRDAEERVRFLGYDPANIKLVAYVVAAVMASIAGAMFVPIVGIITPAEIGASASILMIAGVALGGRASLFGPALGAMAIGWGQSSLGSSWPDGWIYILGLVFILVTLFLPMGLSSLFGRAKSLVWRSRDQRRTTPPRRRLGACARRGEEVTAAEGSLVVKDLRVEFDGFVAVDGVSFDAHPGEVRFLIGPNGAGKTTCIDAITGLSKGTGSVTLGDQELLGKSTQKIVRLGVGRTFQTASVFEQLSVLQNLDIAAGLHRSSLSLLRARRGVDPAIEVALEETGLSSERDTPAGILSHGQKQWLEIGMMLVQEPRALLLDEPVAGMSQDERTATGELLQRIAERRIVLVVEHDMDFMRRYASRVTVLHQGKLLSEGTVAQVQADPKVQEVYLGTAGAPTTAAMLVVADSTIALTDAATQGEGA